MTSYYEVPTQPLPQLISINIAGAQYQLYTYWSIANNCWLLDMRDTNGGLLVSAIPLVTGVDLLEQYGHLNFGFQLIAQTDNSIQTPPTFQTLGATGHLYVGIP